MYGNINTTIGFSALSSALVTILPANTGDVVLSLPGARKATDIVTAIQVDPDVAFDIGYADLVSAWVSADDQITLRYYNLVPNTTSLNIAAGTEFKGKVERCDNGFKADGL